MPSLGSTIAATIAGGERAVVEEQVFGSGDADRIAATVDAFCRSALGSGIRRYRFFTSSIGSVHGVELEDRRRVVVKVHQRRVSTPYLRTMVEVQGSLAGSGFPAPEPITGPLPLARGHAVAERWLERGERHDGHDTAYRSAMARTYARLVDLCRPFVASFPYPGTGLHSARRRGLWPRPHSALFDFEATARGAAWIDAIARRALAQLYEHRSAGEVVVAHDDWRAGNLRFDARRRRIAAAYDWDSLGRAREPQHVGWVAHAFCADWERAEPKAPSPDEIRGFVAEYEQARSHRFTSIERSALAAALTYATAYTARCAHAIDPARREFVPGDHRHALREHADELLRI